MKKKEERKYFDKEWKEMKTSLESYLKREQQEDLHKFRVQVKKIRAFLILSDSAGHHPDLIKHFKPVRKIFKKAGEIRNAYMNQKLGKIHQIASDEFMHNQHQLQVTANEKFKLHHAEYLEDIKEAHKNIREKIKPVSDVHINLFYQHQLQQIADSLAQLKFNDQLHTNRKQVKILIYNHKIAHKVLNTGFNENYLEQVQTAIGDWHDHVLAMELFADDNVKNKAAFNNLKQPDKRLREHISGLTADFYNQATTAVEVPVEQLS
ncbi:CHAD domain-containing protein [Mucilaginibacter pocheonensis]|uniref:CHAD domain-containing protein n=1 Tax=Mucilaginibacter pocheonensis TaxID=398050 RepID=A0ABU1TIN1_9SPHI|nr:CHAD domain-containing protein [Mucilaginibacter pocheonensis]MDR6945116.1 CHAD domain-containing protein [Mucilaginibacter pocheonensis]